MDVELQLLKRNGDPRLLSRLLRLRWDALDGLSCRRTSPTNWRTSSRQTDPIWPGTTQTITGAFLHTVSTNGNGGNSSRTWTAGRSDNHFVPFYATTGARHGR